LTSNCLVHNESGEKLICLAYHEMKTMTNNVLT